MKSTKFHDAGTSVARASDSGGLSAHLTKAIAIFCALLAGYLLALATDAAFAAESAHKVGEVRNDGYVWTEFTHTETVPVTAKRLVLSTKHIAAGCGAEFGYYGGLNRETGEKLPAGVRSKQGDLIDWAYNDREIARYNAHVSSGAAAATAVLHDPHADLSGFECKTMDYLQKHPGQKTGGAWVNTSFYAERKIGEKTETVVDFACWATPEGYHDPACKNPAHTGHNNPNAQETPSAKPSTGTSADSSQKAPSTKPSTETSTDSSQKAPSAKPSTETSTDSSQKAPSAKPSTGTSTDSSQKAPSAKPSTGTSADSSQKAPSAKPSTGTSTNSSQKAPSPKPSTGTSANSSQKAPSPKPSTGTSTDSSQKGTPNDHAGLMHLYDPNTGTDYYTDSIHEKNIRVMQGWLYKGRC